MKREFPEVTVISPDSSEGGENRYFSTKSAKNKLLPRIFEQAVLVTGFVGKIFRRIKKGDILFTGTNPVLLLILMPVLKVFVGFKWCLLVHDVFPDNLVPAGITRRDGIVFRFLDYVFSRIYGSADRLIVIGRDMESLVVDKIGRAEKIVFIHNWADEEEIFPIPRTDALFINDLGWENKIVFQFFGNIGRLQGVEFILNAIAMCRSTDAAFLFIGGGVMVDKIKQFVHMHPDKNVAYAGVLDLDKKNLGLAACDVAIVSLEKGMLGLGVPSKAYFSMAADKPLLVVMEGDAEIARVVRETGIGWQCEPDSPDELAALIDQITREKIVNLKGVPRSVLNAHYSEENALVAYTNCLAALIE
jgi:glycosyltransferase involved in cell wall biosynthesis